MSAEILQAIAEAIRTKMSVSANDCHVNLDGQPPPMSGAVFYAVHRLATRSEPLDYGLEQVITVGVTVSVRTGQYPGDMIGSKLILKATTGLVALEERVISALHKKYAVVSAANDLAVGEGGGYNCGYPPVWESTGPYIERQGSWWFSDDPKVCGVSFEMVFGGIHRMRYMGDLP